MITQLFLCAISLLSFISSAHCAAAHDEVIKMAESNKYSHPWNTIFKQSYQSMVFANVVMGISGITFFITLIIILMVS